MNTDENLNPERYHNSRIRLHEFSLTSVNFNILLNRAHLYPNL